MAITFNGTVRINSIYGNDSTVQNLITIENKKGSQVDMHIKRLLCHEDHLATLTSVAPIIRTLRASNISGGIIMDKGTFDSLQTSDPFIQFRSAAQEGSAIVASASAETVWQQFANRMHTGVEQQYVNDSNLLPLLCQKEGKEFVLRPGESILVRVVSPTNASNPFQNNNWTVMCEWEENTVSTFTISGIVTLGGSPVAEAKVLIIEADDEIMTNGYLKEIITTPAGGNWSSTIATGKVGAVFIQYKNGATYYTAPGSPFLS